MRESTARSHRHIHAPVGYAVQKQPQNLHDVVRSSEVYAQAFDGLPVSRFDKTTQSAISRARNMGANPLATLKAHLRKHKRAGGTHEQALLLVADLAAFVDGLHGETLDCTDAAIRKASVRETERQGRADLAQLALHECSALSTKQAAYNELTEEAAAIHALRVMLARRIGMGE